MQTPVSHDLVIKKIEPLRNTANGNLRHVVEFTDGTVAYTAPDAIVGRIIGNVEYRDVPLTVEFDRQGRITNVVASG